nr:hypothetical protein 1 [Pseudomonadaceae bacterium]BDD44424.1 hypothetical protein 8 [Pseudomonadaceae bacterium]
MATEHNNGHRTTDLEALSGLDHGEMCALPGEVEIRAPRGTLPAGREGIKHGWHSTDAVQIPTSLTCNLCPLYHVKRKDRRHPLACPEGRKNQIYPILTQLQQRWAEGLILEVQAVTGESPTPSDNARIEQIIRHRSKIFQIENYLKVAGLIDLKKGEVRNVSDRLTTTENALGRALTEFRQAMAERRGSKPPGGPRLDEYLRQLGAREEVPEGDDSQAEPARVGREEER